MMEWKVLDETAKNTSKKRNGWTEYLILLIFLLKWSLFPSVIQAALMSSTDKTSVCTRALHLTERLLGGGGSSRTRD